MKTSRNITCRVLIKEVAGLWFSSRTLIARAYDILWIKRIHSPMGWEYNKYSSPIYEGDIDFKKVVKILRKVNYQGDLCLENETLSKYPENRHAEILKKEIALLRNLNR